MSRADRALCGDCGDMKCPHCAAGFRLAVIAEACAELDQYIDELKAKDLGPEYVGIAVGCLSRVRALGAST